MIDLLTFEQVLSRTTEGNRVALLGNGFSVACRPDIFTYRSIRERFEQSLSDANRARISAVFDALGTNDFERVMNALDGARRIAPHYALSPSEVEAFERDTKLIRGALIDTITTSHPESPHDLGDEEYAAAAAFLQKFDFLYSLNYDLLLYWAILHGRLESRFQDGFRNADDDPDGAREYVEWRLGYEGDPTLQYIHGALHLFAAGSHLHKLTWSRTQCTLKEQVLKQLEVGRYPLFVAEGNSESKLAKIVSHAYLARSFRSFAQRGRHIVVFGCSLGESDAHVAEALAKNRKVNTLSVALHGDPERADNQVTRAACERIKQAQLLRRQGQKNKGDFALNYFDSASANVWSAPAQTLGAPAAGVTR